MFPRLKQNIEDAKAKLEAQLVSVAVQSFADVQVPRSAQFGVLNISQEKDKDLGNQSTPEDVTKAKEAVAAAVAAIGESSS